MPGNEIVSLTMKTKLLLDELFLSNFSMSSHKLTPNKCKLSIH